MLSGNSNGVDGEAGLKRIPRLAADPGGMQSSVISQGQAPCPTEYNIQPFVLSVHGDLVATQPVDVSSE